MTTTGAPLNLTLPPSGEVGWTAEINANWTGINTAIAALQAGGSSGAQGNPGSAGAVGIIWAGPWGSGTPYVTTDAVSFNGSSYLALANNTGVQPDTHPGTWALLAMGGAQGPVGPAGPQGPAGSGGGSSVTFPISVVEGGTGASDADDARVNLRAASSGINDDILALNVIQCGTSQNPTTTGITIRSAGGEGTALSVGNGSVFGGITSAGGFFAAYVACLGQINCANIICSGNGVQSRVFAEASVGQGMGFQGQARFQQGLILQGSIPIAGPNEVAFGAGTSATATPGSSGSLPATVAGYLIFNNQGINCKIPYYGN